MEPPPNLAIIGAGNVATHLAPALDGAGRVRQVCARRKAHAEKLAAALVDCEALDDPAKILPDTDFCIIAVSDDSIAAVARCLPPIRGIVAHTSGSVGIEALAGAERRAVLYPLMTFSASAKVDVAEVPFFTEASSAEALAAIDALALSIGASVHHADSAQRAWLHIAAVMSCNFANHLWAISDQLLAPAGYEFSVLGPLLRATLDKALGMPPAQAQTGPAARGDVEILAKHEAMLPPDLKEIYTILSSSIMRHRNRG